MQPYNRFTPPRSARNTRRAAAESHAPLQLIEAVLIAITVMVILGLGLMLLEPPQPESTSFDEVAR